MVLSRARISRINPNLDIVDVILQGDGADDVQTDVPLSQPYAGRGWGIRAGIETDSLIIIDQDSRGSYKILGYLGDSKFFKDGAENLTLPRIYQLQTKYKVLKEGEIVLQSKENSQVFLDYKGGIKLSTSDGNSLAINKATDSVYLTSQNVKIQTEASLLRNGLVKRDLRTEEEKIEDLVLDSLVLLENDNDERLDLVGADPSHKLKDDFITLQGVFDPTDSEPLILKIPGLKDIKKASLIVDNVKNPALAEYRLEVNEFSDGVSSLNLVSDEDLQKEGRLPLNLAARQTFGTLVNENGTLARFDYIFGSGEGKAHKEIWKLPSINETHRSVDFRVDLKKSIQDSSRLGSSEEWRIQSLDQFNAAIGYQLLLNTRGADHQGKIPSSTSIGSLWSFQVDKEGLTKWNIPASTSLKEPFRNGRSLLWNLDGSLTQSIGKENNQELPNITGKSWDQVPESVVKFVNVLPGRESRSLTLDLEGSEERRLGMDSAGQSSMLQADGALAFYYGKFLAGEPSITKSPSSKLESPSKSGTREGVSIAGRTAGSVELDLGVDDTTNLQSLSLVTAGVSNLSLGKDEVKDSLNLDAAGNVRIKVAGGHKLELLTASNQSFSDGIILTHGTGSLIQIDKNGVITIRNSEANSNIIMSAEGDITAINTSGKISLAMDGTIGLGSAQAGIDISPTLGVVLRTAGGSFTLSPTGKVDVAATGGCTVTGTFFHANTTATLLSPGAASSPFTVAAAGPGMIDVLDGTSIAGFSTVKA